MASPNPHQAKINLQRVDTLAVEVYVFLTYQQPPIDTTGLSQTIFNEAVSIASDPASTIDTIARSGELATMLHPWVIHEGGSPKNSHPLLDIQESYIR